MREVSVFLHTLGISIALAIRSLDLALGLFGVGWLGVAIHLSRRWHSQRLVRSAHPTRNGGRGISIALTIRSLDPTLQMYKVELKFKCSNG